MPVCNEHFGQLPHVNPDWVSLTHFGKAAGCLACRPDLTTWVMVAEPVNFDQTCLGELDPCHVVIGTGGCLLVVVASF